MTELFKKILAFAVVFFATFFVFYLVGVFLVADFNPLNWNLDARVTLLVFGGFPSLIFGTEAMDRV